MNIAVFIDSFKGTLSSLELSHMIEEHFLKTHHHVSSVPISDGGEGFIDAIEASFPNSCEHVETEGPLGEKIEAKYILHNTQAFIGLHTAAGLTLLKKSALSPTAASSYGVGLIINDAIKKGAKKIVLGIGGSATNDGGAGFLQALGVRFFKAGSEIKQRMNGDLIDKVTAIDIRPIQPILNDVEFVVASDVKAPLLGPLGCANMFSIQKGATNKVRDYLENAMKHYADVVERTVQKRVRNIAGAGAAGGAGFGAMSLLNATIVSGIDYLIQLLDIEKRIMESDVVIVGEGRLDHQTIQGKAPYGIASLAKKHKKTVIGLFGSLKDDLQFDLLDQLYVVAPEYASHEESLLRPKVAFKKMLNDVKIDA